MAALTQSVKAARESRGEDATVHDLPEKTAAKKTAAKKAAAKKTAKKAPAKKSAGRRPRRSA